MYQFRELRGASSNVKADGLETRNFKGRLLVLEVSMFSKVLVNYIVDHDNIRRLRLVQVGPFGAIDQVTLYEIAYIFSTTETTFSETVK